MKHPHAELMAQYAQDAMETDKPWERWEYDNDREWVRCRSHPSWQVEQKYRRKPRTININGFEVPEPERTAPPIGTLYFSPGIRGENNPHRASFDWDGDQFDLTMLRNGWVHLTVDAADIHHNALISFTRK